MTDARPLREIIGEGADACEGVTIMGDVYLLGDAILAALAAAGMVVVPKLMIENAESALDMYGNENHWHGDTFRPIRLEATCKCLCCYEAFSDRGEKAREVVTEVENAIAAALRAGVRE